MLGEIGVQILHAVDVVFPPVTLTVRDECNAVSALQHELPNRSVVRLPGDGVKLKANLVRADGAEVDRQVVEEERTVAARGEGRERADLFTRQGRVQVREIRCLA